MCLSMLKRLLHVNPVGSMARQHGESISSADQQQHIHILRSAEALTAAWLLWCGAKAEVIIQLHGGRRISSGTLH